MLIFPTDIVRKVPIVPIIQQQTIPTQKLPTISTIAQQQNPPKIQSVNVTAMNRPKTTKKAGHNIIERRYRTSIVLSPCPLSSFGQIALL